MFRALPGFRDFLPGEMAVRRHIEQAWHAAARAAGFQEVDGPPLESLELFAAKSGPAIAEELYAFTDKGGREVALRAELTPTVGRLVAAHAQSLKKPVKWYAVPQLFRYQRQQRGRLREHIQFNVDVIGAAEVGADAEICAVALDALRRLGLTGEHVYVRANHRVAVDEKLAELDCTDAERVLRLIDRDALTEENASGALDASAVRALQDWLDEPGDGDAFGDDPFLGDFLAACEDFGIRGCVAVDRRIVRGLAYYTGLVFEIFDRGHELRAVAGGGRYDTLVEKLGGPPLPALGFGMGDVVLAELLAGLGLLPDAPPRLDDYVVPIGAEMVGPARQVVRRLRDAGRSAEAPYGPVKVGKAFKAAEQAGAMRVFLVGPDEWADGAVKVKELAGGGESVAYVADL